MVLDLVKTFWEDFVEVLQFEQLFAFNSIFGIQSQQPLHNSHLLMTKFAYFRLVFGILLCKISFLSIFVVKLSSFNVWMVIVFLSEGFDDLESLILGGLRYFKGILTGQNLKDNDSQLPKVLIWGVHERLGYVEVGNLRKSRMEVRLLKRWFMRILGKRLFRSQVKKVLWVLGMCQIGMTIWALMIGVDGMNWEGLEFEIAELVHFPAF